MSIVVLATEDTVNYYGPLVPVVAKWFVNKDYRTSESVPIAKGSKDNPNFSQNFVASMNGTKIRVTGGNIHSTTDAVEGADVTGSLVVYDANGTVVKTLYTNLRIPPETPTTWAAIQAFSRGKRQTYPATYLSSAAIEARLALIVNGAALSSEVANGVLKLDTVPSTVGQPIALGVNSPVITDIQGDVVAVEAGLLTKQDTLVSGTNIKTIGSATLLGAGDIPLNFVGSTDAVIVAVKQTKYLASYATLLDAKNAVGETKTTLKVTSPVVLDATLDFGAFVHLSFEGTGKITIPAGMTLTVRSMDNPGNKQVFSLADATANVHIGRGAAEKFNVAWIAGTTDLSVALNQAIASVNANGRGTIYIPSGEWTTTGNHVLVGGINVEGAGIGTAGIGTRITLTTATKSIFKIGNTTYDIRFRDLILDGGVLAATDGILCQGAFPNTSRNIRCEGVEFDNLTHGFRVLATDGWQVAGISFDAYCLFNNCSHSGIRCNSQNTAFNIDANFFVPDTGWATYFESVGATVFRGCEFAGGTYSGNNQRVTNTVVAPSGITTSGNAKAVITKAGMTGSPLTVTVPVTTAAHTTASLIGQAFRDALNADPTVSAYFFVTGTGADVELSTLDPADNDTFFNFTIQNDTSVGITNSLTALQTTDGSVDSAMSEGVCYVGGGHLPIVFIGCQDEAFRTFIQNDGSDLSSGFVLTGNLIQAPIRLNQSCFVTSTGNLYRPKVFRDGVASGAAVSSFGDMVTTYWSGTSGVQYTTAQRLSNMTNVIGGAGVTFIVDPAAQGPVVHAPFKVFQNDRWFSLDANPTAEILTTRNKAQLRLGRSTATGVADFYYDLKRENAGTGTAGRLKLTGNQAGAIGYDLNGDVNAVGAVRGGAYGLTDGATITIDPKLANHFYVTLGGDRTLAVNVLTDVTDEFQKTRADGQTITVEAIQDATGSHTLAFPTTAGQFSFGTTIPSVALTTAANKRDIITFQYSKRADRWLIIGFQANFS